MKVDDVKELLKSNKWYVPEDDGPRRSGRTTREIDKAIQHLFTTGSVMAHDHYPSDQMRKYVFSRILKRLESEHPNVKITIDKDLYVIKLVDAI
jgi:hypothetical protein